MSEIQPRILAAAGSQAATRPSMDAGEKAKGEYYELRLYHLRRGPEQERMTSFLRDAWLPAMKRIGVGPIGVFEVLVGSASPTIYILIPHQSLNALVAAEETLAKDSEFASKGAPFINAPASDPSYVRMESSLMSAFEGMPRLEVPDFGAKQGGRIFELRTYESHSRKAHETKIKMFNEGEIAIFRRTGLKPVFFGSTLVGPQMPQLTYMISFESQESRSRNWAVFVSDPEWQKLKSTPGYADSEIVSNITNILLKPSPLSEI